MGQGCVVVSWDGTAGMGSAAEYVWTGGLLGAEPVGRVWRGAVGDLWCGWAGERLVEGAG